MKNCLIHVLVLSQEFDVEAICISHIHFLVLEILIEVVENVIVLDDPLNVLKNTVLCMLC